MNSSLTDLKYKNNKRYLSGRKIIKSYENIVHIIYSLDIYKINTPLLKMVLKIINIKCWQDTSKWNCHTQLIDYKMVQPLCNMETHSEVWTC